MPFALALAFGVCGALAALLAVVNAVQVFLGRQLVKPSASRRSPRQLRAESAAASVAMLGASLTTFGVPAGGLWTAVGVLVLLPGWIVLALVRRHFAAVAAETEADAVVVGTTSVDPE